MPNAPVLGSVGDSEGRAQSLGATPDTCAPLSSLTVIHSKGPLRGPRAPCARTTPCPCSDESWQDSPERWSMVDTLCVRLIGDEATAPPPTFSLSSSSSCLPVTCVPSQANLDIYGKPEEAAEEYPMRHASFFLSLCSGVPATPLRVNLRRGSCQCEGQQVGGTLLSNWRGGADPPQRT